MPLAEALRTKEDGERLAASLKAFIPEAWKIIEPGREFIGNWHIDAIAEHLEAVTDGLIKRLLINVPFRTSKSSVVSVIWPAWVWTHSPEHQWLCTAYAEKLAVRDSRKMRRLIQSRWYRARWGHAFDLSTNQALRFENNMNGHRIAAGMSNIMGDGGDTIIIDDPHDREGAESDVQREKTIDNYDGAVIPRLNDPNTSALVCIMQRLNMGDLSGHMIKQGCDHLVIPMEYERAHPFVSHTALGWKDPRTRDGELMWPARFSRATVEDLKAGLASAASGQLQQRPSPDGGAILVRDWWQVWTEPKLPKIEHVVLSFDTAHKEKLENDYSAMTAWGLFHNGEDEELSAILLRGWQKRLKFPDLVDKAKSEIEDEEERYGGPPEFVVIEDKSAGISLIQVLHEAGIKVFAYNPGKEGKVQRAHVQSIILRSKRVFVLGRKQLDGTRSPTEVVPFAKTLMDQCELFPNDEHDDLVDTCVQAWAFMSDSGYLIADTALPPEVTFGDAGPRKAFYG